MLDVGPVCSDTINFVIHRVRRVSVCDLFGRLKRAIDQPAFVSSLGGALDYPAGSFDSIHLWDLVDRLGDESAAQTVQHLRRLLKPGGAVLLIAGGERSDGAVYAFAVRENQEIAPRPQPHLLLPYHHRCNRDIMKLLEPLAPAESFVYRSGMREFRFR